MGGTALEEQRRLTTPERPRRALSLAARQRRLAWVLLLPTLVVVVAVALLPLAQTVYYSFTNERLGSLDR
ncbi:MAG: sugar ABC transporter permease, partial [Sphaerobacter sp.]|nr:sugar ABC transporter permease [Sphaerobacter sp.]